MSVRKIKKKIYLKIWKLIFWRLIMFYVQRVRIKNNMVEPVGDGDIIELPDQEMWAVYKRGETTHEALLPSLEKANKLCEILNKIFKKTIKKRIK